MVVNEPFPTQQLAILGMFNPALILSQRGSSTNVKYNVSRLQTG